MEKNPRKEDLERNLKPAGSYLDSLSSFADLLGSIRQAEDAAKELLQETSTGSRKTGENAAKTENTAKTTENAAKTTENAAKTTENAAKTTENAAKTTENAAKTGENASGTTGENASQSSEPEEKLQTVEELMAKLDELVGLEKIKQNVKSLINYVKIRKLRDEEKLPNPPLSLHMVFMGNPGTGKTTVARILSELYRAIGVLSKGQLVEVDRSGLVAGFVGQTAIKTTEVVNSALGGILFIDEAYSLAPDIGSGNDFGREAIESLLKLMEDHRDDLIVIVAGYSDQMERFISSNPGLESRFNRYFMFEDYNSEELFDIFSTMCKKSEYVLDDDAIEFAREHFKEIYDYRDDNFGNARHVRNFFENIVSVHSDRVSGHETHTREDLTIVIKEDLEKAALF
ncbi:MAG: AAA family ATPase [Oscillospiraceae bacterium]|nr:AAA family ATPase [Oscillospiraceae bacterium]